MTNSQDPSAVLEKVKELKKVTHSQSQKSRHNTFWANRTAVSQLCDEIESLCLEQAEEIKRMKSQIEDIYEKGYKDGESSRQADYMALIEDETDFTGTVSPVEVSRYIKSQEEEIKRLRGGRQEVGSKAVISEDDVLPTGMPFGITPFPPKS